MDSIDKKCLLTGVTGLCFKLWKKNKGKYKICLESVKDGAGI